MNFTQRFNCFNPGRLFLLGTGIALFSVLVLAGSPGLLEAGSKPPTPVIRFHLQASPGMPPEQTVPVTLISPQQVIAVRRLPELTEKHIETIQKIDNGQVLIVFNSVGANLLEGATSSSIGAIMVVICDGRVVYAPVIDLPLRTGRIIIPGGISDQEILAFQKAIAAKKKT